MLINNGADVNITNEINKTPLCRACEKRNTEIARLLIQSNADVSITNKNNKTPLLAACENGHTEIARLLIIEGRADVNIRNERGDTLLRIAWENNYTKITSLLIKNGADLNENIKLVYILLHKACKKGDYHMAEMLINNGADVNITNKQGNTFLHIACENRNTEIARLLIIEGRADVNIRNERGDTPLHIACDNGYTEIARLLIKNGTDLQCFLTRGNLEEPIFIIRLSFIRNVIENFNKIMTQETTLIAFIKALQCKGSDAHEHFYKSEIFESKLVANLASYNSPDVQNSSDKYNNSAVHSIFAFLPKGFRFGDQYISKEEALGRINAVIAVERTELEELG